MPKRISKYDISPFFLVNQINNLIYIMLLFMVTLACKLFKIYFNKKKYNGNENKHFIINSIMLIGTYLNNFFV